MKKLKKKQHYVWKYYLKAWATNEQIFCKRNNEVFLTSLENVGQNRFFYEAISLNETELEHVQAFYKKAHPTAEKNLTDLLNLYVISSEADDYTKKCGIEEFHTIVESKATDVLNMLYSLDLSFFEKTDYRNNFAFFVGCQYTRTMKMRENFLGSPLNIQANVSKEKLAKIYSLFFADIIANWIYSRSRVKLMINESTTCSFITTDQPVVNAKGNGDYLKPVQQFELYYPISPKIALYLSEDNEGIERIAESKVKEFNRLIVNHSNEQIYATNRFDFNGLAFFNVRPG